MMRWRTHGTGFTRARRLNELRVVRLSRRAPVYHLPRVYHLPKGLSVAEGRRGQMSKVARGHSRADWRRQSVGDRQFS
jgi:hypothetical protein